MGVLDTIGRMLESLSFGRYAPCGEQNAEIATGEVVLTSVSKRFRRSVLQKSSYTTVKSGVLGRESKRRSSEDPGYSYALDTVSIRVAPGQALGIIGRNGSGKSTLLKLISGIYLPDEGQVLRRGRISALIELGAGFHPDFTGRENVYLGGVMYGLSRKEIDERFDSIVAYAELEDCIDDPVRTYSSGMYMRLGFSLAIHTDPDILLIDEVLAVGDAAFISKCHDTISEMKRRGKTLIFVTHDLPSVVRWCDEVVWLKDGVIRERGEPRRIIDAYLAEVEEGRRESLVVENERLREESSDAQDSDERWGNREVEILDVRMVSANGQSTWLFDQKESITVEFRYRINKAVEDLVFGVGIERADGLQVHGTNTAIEDVEIPLESIESVPLEGTVRYHIERIGLVGGSYFLDVAAHREDGYPFDYHHRMHKFSVRSEKDIVGVIAPEHHWEIHVDGRQNAEEKRRLA